MKLSVKGISDHLLEIQMNEGEEIVAKRNSFVSCKGSLSIIGEFSEKDAKKTLVKQVSKNDIETKQRIISKGQSTIVLAPPAPGDIHVIECSDNQQYILLEHSFFVRTKNVTLSPEFSVIGKYSYFPTHGNGFIALSAFGDFMEIKLEDDTIIVDDSHILAWSKELDMEIIDVTKTNTLLKNNEITIKDGNLDLNVVNGKLTGEDLLFKFKGTGKIITCTRNKHIFWQDLVNK